MLLSSPKKIKSRDHDLLAQTGITKAGYLLKQKCKFRWESCFLILNDHCLTYCSEEHNFSKPDGNLLLSASTRVYIQHGEEAVIRIETGFEVLFLKGRDFAETKEWKKAIHTNAGKLSGLARGLFGVKCKNGRVNDHFLMLHSQGIITIHPSFGQARVIDRIYSLTEHTSFAVKGNTISIKSEDSLTIVAKNDIEQKSFIYALEIIVSSLSSFRSKVFANPPPMPVHSGTLLSLDASTMKWTKKYLVLTDDSIYIQPHRKVGFDAPQRHKLTPNAMIFSTTLKPHSFEVVLFSESLHLASPSEKEKSDFLHILEQLIPKSTYDLNDQLQSASLERKVNAYDIELKSAKAPGVILERRGNWALAAVVSDSISRKLSKGSILSSIKGESVVLTGFESVVSKLSLWKAPLRLSFWTSPQKMGWLTMMVTESNKSWKASRAVRWERVYATVSTGVMSIYIVLKDGKSKKQVFGLYGSAVGLVAPESVSGNKNCFRVVNGIEKITLQAASYDDMMDWSTIIVHGISMENGGGILLGKAKKETANVPVDNCQQPSISCGFEHNDDRGVKSIVFAKPKAKHSPIKSKSIDSSECPPNFETLNASRSTDMTEINTTFRSLDPVDLSETMEDFANNFFMTTINDRCSKNAPKSALPLQALRVQDLSYESIESSGSVHLDEAWYEIDKASNTGSVAMSDEEVIDKYDDVNAYGHINSDDFAKLLQCNHCVGVTKGRVQKIDEFVV
ncbi:hypothetical protein HJC23_001015 [Cyclotella cryptica]|uniref:PH domain-containing protein n=1 Tax=Cyclotella cryptica TaxID=29204 RepID=A0ABD3NYI6_9STRA|eukprot:CCRYP_018874-RA/>CCRYP_018874-RA protein AED:0.05 eAED:0.06 QI:1476/1/0.85/1/0.66/0.42/7/0/734